MKQPENLSIQLGGVPILSQAYDLGRGFDIFGAFRASSMKKQLLDFSSVSMQTFTLLGTDYLVPDIVIAVESTLVGSQAGAFSSREGLQNSFASHVGASLDAGAFSGQMSVAYGREFQSNTDYFY